jgi:P pilus assembly chaperone PapD
MHSRPFRFFKLRHPGPNAIAVFLSIWALPALADLMLYPTRIVLQGNERTAQVELVNNAATPATYRISLVNRRMSETGTFSAIEDDPLPGERFAAPMLRYSPRQVTLAPGEGQTVRLMVRKPAGLESGEYRSHLLFSRQPTVEEPRSAEDLNNGSEQIGVQITALVGASIPVIVRHGQTSADVKLTQLKLIEDGSRSRPLLAFVIERDGNQSVYGDFTVTYTPQDGQVEVIARASGVAVYTPNPLRRASLPLQLDERLTGGTLQLIYRQPAEDGGSLLAKASLMLP